MDRQAGGAGGLRQLPANLSAHIGDSRDLHAGGLQLQSRPVGGIVSRDQRHAAPGQYAVAIQIAARGAGQQYAGPIVARKNQRPLERAAGKDHLASAHLPQPLARPLGWWIAQMILQAFTEREEVVAEIAKRGGARAAPSRWRAPLVYRAVLLSPARRRQLAAMRAAYPTAVRRPAVPAHRRE